MIGKKTRFAGWRWHNKACIRTDSRMVCKGLNIDTGVAMYSTYKIIKRRNKKKELISEHYQWLGKRYNSAQDARNAATKK